MNLPAATCNGCHTPHALIPKYYVKAKNGFWHCQLEVTAPYELERVFVH